MCDSANNSNPIATVQKQIIEKQQISKKRKPKAATLCIIFRIIQESFPKRYSELIINVVIPRDTIRNLLNTVEDHIRKTEILHHYYDVMSKNRGHQDISLNFTQEEEDIFTSELLNNSPAKPFVGNLIASNPNSHLIHLPPIILCIPYNIGIEHIFAAFNNFTIAVKKSKYLLKDKRQYTKKNYSSLSEGGYSKSRLEWLKNGIKHLRTFV